jgi:hypothetical protein
VCSLPRAEKEQLRQWAEMFKVGPKVGAGSRMDVKAYAEKRRAGAHHGSSEVCAARVAESADPNVGITQFMQLVEIHAAPEWLWRALVEAMVEGKWPERVSR